MAYDPIFLGTGDNTYTGEAPKPAGVKINNMLRELYNVNNAGFSTQTGNYVLAIGDAGTVVEMNVATANTLTVPPNSSVPFDIGTVIRVLNYGAGITTIVAGGGVTVRALNTLALKGQNAEVRLRKRATNEWIATGDLT